MFTPGSIPPACAPRLPPEHRELRRVSALRRIPGSRAEGRAGCHRRPTGWQQSLRENQGRLLQEWAQSSAFVALCGGTRSSSEYVDVLLANTHIPATPEYRNSLIADLDARRKTQADVLREIVEHEEFKRMETNRAFVLMQYYGYLRRDPDDAPEANLNFDGYNFWLAKLEQFGGDFVRAEMVKAFITSDEYLRRFGM